jgi:hypothetical protein
MSEAATKLAQTFVLLDKCVSNFLNKKPPRKSFERRVPYLQRKVKQWIYRYAVKSFLCPVTLKKKQKKTKKFCGRM